MSDATRKDPFPAAQETSISDFQKSIHDKVTESVTGNADSEIASSQKLSDETSFRANTASDQARGAISSAPEAIGNLGHQAQSTAGTTGPNIFNGDSNNVQTTRGTASDISQKAASNTNPTGEQGKTYLQQARELASETIASASNAARNIANKISSSSTGEGTSK